MRSWTPSNVSLASLYAETLQQVVSSAGIEDDFMIVLIELIAQTASMAGGVGPILLVIYDDELSDAEVEEALQVNGPVDRNDRLLTERITRPVWIVSALTGSGLFTGPNGETVIRWKPPGGRWTFSDGEGWALGVYNLGDSNFTAGIIKASMTAFGRWIQ